jgi:hypothetical protein
MSCNESCMEHFIAYIINIFFEWHHDACDKRLVKDLVFVKSPGDDLR